MGETTMGPLEKGFAERTNNADYWLPKGEISRIYRHLDAMSDHNVDVTEMVNPHAEALRVAVEALEPWCFFAADLEDGEEDTVQSAWEIRYKDRFKDWCCYKDIEQARTALARIKEIMGDVK
ncbi:hypothetical protein [Asticcacaulis endophyticus]|uniref:Uncharacterized protein n=1 Tax=Asticcacaulis endophyticus TaxID=1395890 RepID=A0A918PTE7_9CAUL|nr:hypothetical protein [Asticcacaulis endophyticus]GGZ22071.1 hypothetical protein GCM10011273_03610 [Asticcacaulis endophyticus]